MLYDTTPKFLRMETPHCLLFFFRLLSLALVRNYQWTFIYNPKLIRMDYSVFILVKPVMKFSSMYLSWSFQKKTTKIPLASQSLVKEMTVSGLAIIVNSSVLTSLLLNPTIHIYLSIFKPKRKLIRSDYMTPIACFIDSEFTG